MLERTVKPGFTLTELFVSISLAGLLALFFVTTILPSNINNKEQQKRIAETYKTELASAFQVDTAQTGLIQKTETPSDVVSSALKYTLVDDSNTDFREYKTPLNWHIKVPKEWTPQSGGGDKADITVFLSATDTYTFSVYRHNNTTSTTTLASNIPLDTGTSTNTGTVATQNPTAPNPTPPVVNNPASPPPTWVATVTVRDDSSNLLSGATVTGSSSDCGSGTTNASGQAILMNIPDGVTCSYTASKPSFTTVTSSSQVMTGNKSFNITLTPLSWTATVAVNSTLGAALAGATVTSSNPACGSGTTNTSGIVTLANIADGTSCSYSASKVGYVTAISVTKVMSADQSFTIALTPSPLRNAQVNVVDQDGNPVPGAIITTGTAGCNGSSGIIQNSGVANIAGIQDGITCSYSASATGYTPGSSAALLMNQNQMFTIVLNTTQTTGWGAYVTVVDADNHAITSANITASSSACTGDGMIQANGVANINNIADGTSCSYSASAPGYLSDTSTTIVMHASQNFRIILPKITVRQNYSYIDAYRRTSSDIFGNDPYNTNDRNSFCTFYHANNQSWTSQVDLYYIKKFGGDVTPDPTSGKPKGCYGVGNAKWQALYNTQTNGGDQYIFDPNGNLVDLGRGAYLDYSDNLMYLPDGTQVTSSGIRTFLQSQGLNLGGNISSLPALMQYISYYNAFIAPTKSPPHPIDVVANVNGTYYYVMTDLTRASPIKINLLGMDAIVSDKGGFKIDLDGFHHNLKPAVMTSGGLDNNEAWLVLDRGHTGIIKNGIVDGDAVFGDHNSKYKSGYEDLSQAFEHDLVTDVQGHKKYIQFTPLPWYESLWHKILKFFGFHVNYNAYEDLQLLTTENKLLDAHTVLNRIDVTYDNVAEYSPNKLNAIFQRADVYYKDGHKARSGDLWFAPKPMTYLIPLTNSDKKRLHIKN